MFLSVVRTLSSDSLGTSSRVVSDYTVGPSNDGGNEEDSIRKENRMRTAILALLVGGLFLPTAAFAGDKGAATTKARAYKVGITGMT